MDDLVQQIGMSLVEETVDQFTGRSRKKWAVALVAFVAGAAIAGYLLRRRRQPPTSSADASG
jgi:hypothetical protein